MIYILCEDFSKDCCCSCHDEADQGYQDLYEFAPTNRNNIDSKYVVIRTCCKFAYIDLDRKLIANIVRGKRNAERNSTK